MVGRPTNSRAFALAALLSTACAEDTLTSIASVTDEFVQNTASAVDILFVVDNSESMTEEQAGIGASFQAFIGNLTASQVDYHIGVINTDVADGGRLHVGGSGVPFIHSEVANAEQAFLDNVRVGITGARQEKAFESAALALGVGGSWDPATDPIVDPNNGEFRDGTCLGDICARHEAPCVTNSDCDQKFLRDDAALFLIMVSDEEEGSFGPVSYYWRLFDGYRGPGNEARVSVSAIIGPPATDGCFASGRGSAAPGFRFANLAAQTGGIVTSICGDFAEALRDLSITAAGLRSAFELSSLADKGARVSCPGGDAEGFCVHVNGRRINPNRGAGWTYEESRNAIVFGVNELPPPQAKITVAYREARR